MLDVEMFRYGEVNVGVLCELSAVMVGRLRMGLSRPVVMKPDTMMSPMMGCC